MSGTVMKRPVRYNAEGAWILKDQFFSFHMKDAAVPPAYEANLFIGIDSSKGQFVAHWLDAFGGAGSRVVGFGPLSGEKIEIIYPYAEGKFRNTFHFDSALSEWTFLIESEDTGGTWAVFAQYTIKRSP